MIINGSRNGTTITEKIPFSSSSLLLRSSLHPPFDESGFGERRDQEMEMETLDPEADQVMLGMNRGGGFCCCCFPMARSSTSSYWRRTDHSSSSSPSWWRNAVDALMKVREWSELVAGPRWKNFIRRFNHRRPRNPRFQYDPLSYALNFDEGVHEDEGDEEFAGDLQRGFSARYAVPSPAPLNSSTTTVVVGGGRDSPRVKV